MRPAWRVVTGDASLAEMTRIATRAGYVCHSYRARARVRACVPCAVLAPSMSSANDVSIGAYAADSADVHLRQCLDDHVTTQQSGRAEATHARSCGASCANSAGTVVGRGEIVW